MNAIGSFQMYLTPQDCNVYIELVIKIKINATFISYVYNVLECPSWEKIHFHQLNITTAHEKIERKRKLVGLL